MKVSVVVPVRNEEATLAALLDSLLRQTEPPDEILIADGGSTDSTAKVARAYAECGVRVLSLGPAYPGRGRNAGILAARNEWSAFVDAGCEADPSWLEALTGEVRAEPTRPGVVFGSYRVRLETEWERAQALAYVPGIDPVTGCRPPSTASCLVHRAAWAAAGGFREDLRAAEDLLFFEGLARAAVPVMRSARAVVAWRLAEGPSEVFRRHRLYSAHHLAAGLGRTWHRRVMAMDGAGLLLAAAGAFAPTAFALLVVAVFARLTKTVLQRDVNIAPVSPWRPDRLARVALLLLLADLATWAGALDHIRRRSASISGHAT